MIRKQKKGMNTINDGIIESKKNKAMSKTKIKKLNCPDLKQIKKLSSNCSICLKANVFTYTRRLPNKIATQKKKP